MIGTLRQRYSIFARSIKCQSAKHPVSPREAAQVQVHLSQPSRRKLILAEMEQPCVTSTRTQARSDRQETQKRPFEGASLPVPKRPSPLPSATPSEASTSKKEGAHLPDIVVRIVGIAMFFLIVELKWLSAAKAEQQDGYYEFEQKDGTRRTTPLPRQSFWAAWRECVYQTLW